MAEVRPFRALRYDEAVAGPLGGVICPPYDVISDEERAVLEGRSAYSFVRVEGGRSGAGELGVTDPYRQAKRTLDEWIARRALRRDRDPVLYLYEHAFELEGQRLRRRGIFVALRLYAEAEGMVLPHEKTIPKDKADRLQLLRDTRTNTSPIFGLFDDPGGAIAATCEGWIAGGLARRLAAGSTATERHTLWAVDGAGAEVLRATIEGSRVYLADGHHRYETALTYLREQPGRADAQAPERYVLAYLCALNDPGLRILPTHRIVRGAADALEAAAQRSFEAAPVDEGAIRDTQPGIVLARDGRFTRLQLREGLDLSRIAELWRSLPVAQAEALLVDPAREAGAVIEYDHDTDRAITAAVAGTSALLLRPVEPDTLKRVADAGTRLPPKTTYFYPKVPAGLVIRTLDED